VTPEQLTHVLADFLGQSSSAVILEDGAVIFDLAEARYSISGEHNKCLLHIWSAERNVVRRVLDLETRGETLRVSVQKMGQNRPTKLEICRERDRRSASAKRTARVTYRRILERALRRAFPEFPALQLTMGIDLEKSFGPVYSRGLLQRGQSAFAVLGVNAEELQTSIDAALTFGILWFDHCRQIQAGRVVVEGLKLFVPSGCSAVVRERMARLNRNAAKWQLYEFDEYDGELHSIDIQDRGNIATRLVRCLDDVDVQRHFAEPINLVRSLMPEAQISAISTAEISFRYHGLEFARARLTAKAGSFHNTCEVLFGTGAEERVLDQSSFAAFERLIAGIGEARHADGPRDNRFWRLHPERWLESLVTENLGSLGSDLDLRWKYSQVPAFSASDRAMIDVLTLTRSGRLAVLELKADEDIHLPLQGMDYWSRVAWHHERAEFQKFGYFAGRELSAEPPLLLMVAPALRIHPATDTLLRYISPEVEWNLLGIDERWRNDLRVIFRKRREAGRRHVA